MTLFCQYIKTIFMKGNINMQKQKRITLNADKRKVIADVFQNHFENNSKFKKAWQEAKETYKDMRSIAKTKIDVLVRTHQPQEDVDTIRAMSNKYGNSGGELYHDNCFYFEIDPCKEHVMHPNHETLDSDENKGCDEPFSSNNSFACERLENLCHCTEGREKYDVDLGMAEKPEQVSP